jgi:hypothetical protein
VPSLALVPEPGGRLRRVFQAAAGLGDEGEGGHAATLADAAGGGNNRR